MKKFVVDSSVFAKLFLEEHDRNKALDFFVLANTEKYRLLVPNIFKDEFLSIVRFKEVDFEEAYEILVGNFETVMKQIDSNKEIMQKALEISKTGNKKSGFPSPYDSTYHALAILNDCDFITADRKYFEKTKKLGHIQLLNDLAL